MDFPYPPFPSMLNALGHTESNNSGGDISISIPWIVSTTIIAMAQQQAADNKIYFRFYIE